MKELHTILYDFDGVIVESNNIKTQAFYELYKGFGNNIAKKVVDHHLENMGVSRFKKIKYYHKNFLNINISEIEYKERLNFFSSIVLQKTIDAPFVLGSIEFIKKNIVNKKQYIITATPKEEIDQITKKRGIMNFFDNIFGSPQTKDFWVKKLIKENQIHPSNSLFIGDAYADYEAAKNNDVYFILRKTKDNKKLQEDLKVDMIDDFIELPQVLNKNYFA